MNNTGTASAAAISTNLNQQQQQQQDHTTVRIVALPTPPPMQPPPNLPRSDLLDGRREDYIKFGVPLYEAAIKGDWKAAKPILDEYPDLIRFSITENFETVLHIAAAAQSSKAGEEFVINLVSLMEKEDLELQNKSNNTPLCLAAAAGNVETARIMVGKNGELAEIPGQSKMMPLYLAALFAKPEMVRYLYGISNQMRGNYWEHDNRGWVLLKCVEADIFDIALEIVKDRPELIVKKGLVSEILLALAQKTQKFKPIKPNIVFRIIKSSLGEQDCEAMQLLRTILNRVSTMRKKEIDDIIRGPCVQVKRENKIVTAHPSRVLFVAARMGNTRFIVEFVRLYPDLIWRKDDKEKTIFHLAIKHRQAEIYNLLYEIGAMKGIITPVKDRKGDNMLHMVAKKAKQKDFQNVSGAAFELQRELLWFKEVEQMIPPTYRQRKNNDGKTPQDLLAEKHAYLVSKGEDWINNYMLVATLIATIVFAAAFTLPGGYNQNTGIPFFRKEPSLIIFVISDAVSLISSSTSVLVFLSILTSRYAERGFMESLPDKLMFGVLTLFLSIVTMMVAFSASFFVLYDKKLKWVPITVTCLATMPVVLFVRLQFRLLVDVVSFTFRSRSLFKPKKRMLYY